VDLFCLSLQHLNLGFIWNLMENTDLLDNKLWQQAVIRV
jgi:hypothetical protein